MTSTNVTIVPRRKRREEVVSGTGFCPSDGQRHFLQLALASTGPLNIGRLCQQVGIARATYYRWREQPGFSAWMSAQWVAALLADGGRLLSIGRANAGSDFRYWRAMAELIFDPRGLGLLTAWQQRMAEASVNVAPLFHEEDPDLDAELDELEPAWDALLPPAARPEPVAPEQGREEAAAAEPPSATVEDGEPGYGPEPDPISQPGVTPSNSMESTTCRPKTRHFAETGKAVRPTDETREDETREKETGWNRSRTRGLPEPGGTGGLQPM